MSPWEMKEYDEAGKLVREERRSVVPALATIGALGTVMYYSLVAGSGLAGGAASAVVVGKPNAPIINLVTEVVDSVSFRVDMSGFAGSGGDTHDSTRILVDSAGKDFTAPILDSLMGPQTIDTVRAAFANGATYDFVALYKGVTGDWSDTSQVFQKAVSFTPYQPNTVSVSSATASSLTLRWVTGHNGKGVKAHHTIRYKNTTGDTATFVWWGTQEIASQSFDSLGTNIGDTVQRVFNGLTAGNRYEFGVVAYRDDEGDGDPLTGQGFVYGPLPVVGTTTAVGNTVGNPPVDTTQTPILSLSATNDTSVIQMNGSGFAGGSQTHDSTRWRLDNNSDMSSPFHDVTSTVDLTSHTVTDNANLTANVTYYGTVQYFGSLDPSAVSAIKSVVNTAPGSGVCPGSTPSTAGYTLLRTHNGQSLTPAGWNFVDGWPELTVHNDATAPDGDGKVLRIRYQAGLPGGQGVDFITTEAAGYLNAQVLYLGFWAKYSTGFQHHPAANKTVYLSGTAFETYVATTGSNFRSEFRTQNPTGSAKNFIPNLATKNLTPGSWHFWEYLVRANTTNNNDGEVRWWVDGVQVGQYTSEPAPDLEFFQIDNVRTVGFNAIWGGTGSTVTTEQYFYYDDICIASTTR